MALAFLEEELKSSLLNLILDQADEGAQKLDGLSSIQRECAVELEGLSEEIKRFVDDKEVFTLAETTKQKLAATVEYSKMIAGKMDRIASLLEELERKYDPEPVDGDESPLRPLKIQLSGSSQQSHQMEIPSHLLVEGVKRSSDS